MARLFELTGEYLQLLETLELGDEDISEDVIKDTLEAVGGEIQDKAISIACICKNIESDIRAFKEEEEKLAKRRRTMERSVQSMKDYVTGQLLKSGITAIKNDPRARISFRKSVSLDISDEDGFVKWAEDNNRDDLLSYKVSASKTAIKQSLDMGAEIPYAHLIEKNSIQIK